MASPLSTTRAWKYGAALVASDAMPLHGDCENPYDVLVRGAEDPLMPALRGMATWREDPWSDYADGWGWLGPRPEVGNVKTDSAYVRVRCRACPACLRLRRRQWTARAIAECRLSRRTWFGTLTYSPEARFVATMRADNLCRRRRAERLDEYDQDAKFRQIVRVTNVDVTKYLKRIRKAAKASLRYCIVSEAHEDGFPHYHLLVHEVADMAVTKRLLEAQWRTGFSHWRLVNVMDPKAAGYVCKYLSKTATTRVRASQDYGRSVESRLSRALASAVSGLRDINP